MWATEECEECRQSFQVTRTEPRTIPGGAPLLCGECSARIQGLDEGYVAGLAEGRVEGRREGRIEVVVGSCRATGPCPQPKACGQAGRCVAGVGLPGVFVPARHVPTFGPNTETPLEVAGVRRAVILALGCHDYGGGYRDKAEVEAYHHGIDTVVNVLRAAVGATEEGRTDPQVNVVESIGREADRRAASSIPVDASPFPGPGDRGTLRQAIATWGVEAQTVMAIEEFGELLTALARFRRGRVARDNVAEEIADAGIMLAQLAEVWGREIVDQWTARKLERLRMRLAAIPQDQPTTPRPPSGFDPGQP